MIILRSRIKELSLIALFPALMGATAGVSIPLFGLPPITLQTLFVFLSGLLLTPKNAFYSMSIYLLLGVIGVPVFSGFNAGFAVLLGPSGGFLFGFPFIAFFTSLLKNTVFSSNSFYITFILILIGTFALYMIGSTYISILYKLNIFSVIAGFALYLPMDILKAFVAVYLYVRVRAFVTYEQAKIWKFIHLLWTSK